MIFGPEMDGHDGANTQEEPFNLPQRLSPLSGDGNDGDKVDKGKVLEKNWGKVWLFANESAGDLGTKEAQAFFCFTKIMATWAQFNAAVDDDDDTEQIENLWQPSSQKHCSRLFTLRKHPAIKISHWDPSPVKMSATPTCLPAPGATQGLHLFLAT